MKKLCIGISSRLISLALTCALLVSVMAPYSYAWEGVPRINEVAILVNNVEMVVLGESMEVETDDGKNVIPASLLYGDVLYLPLLLLLESGMDIDFSEDYQNEENLTIEIKSMDYTLAEPIYPRVQSDKAVSLDMLTNFFNVTIAGKPFATMDMNIEFQGDSIPSIIWKENMMYFPIEAILQILEIDSYWEEDPLTFVIGEQGKKEKTIGIENFTKKNRYTSGQFTDVPSSTWYTNQVKAAFEYGLMVGTNDSSFNPSGNISIAEAITIASRLHNTYYANDYDFQSQTPWYQAYVDYALDNQIIEGSYINYSTPISRSEFAYIIANTFPLPIINEVEDGAIPDVSIDSDYYEAVYLLYRAGIISGTDSIGTFNPDANISRAEVAVILSSMVSEELRKTFALRAPIFPVSIETPPSVAIPLGDTRSIPTTISPANADSGLGIIWSSSNTTIATVDNNGAVTGIKAGTAEILATTANGKTSTCIVNVKSLSDFDIQFSQYALERLKSQLKFPDTLEVFGIWAWTYPSYPREDYTIIDISIYYGAQNSMGLQRRGEYEVYYNMDTGAFSSDKFRDKAPIHDAGVFRVVDISKVLK